MFAFLPSYVLLTWFLAQEQIIDTNTNMNIIQPGQRSRLWAGRQKIGGSTYEYADRL